MRALVTGATGFIGGNLVRELLKQGFRVKALAREDSNRRNIEGLDIEVACGDLRDRDSLYRALDGCAVLFHVAAAYTFWSPHPAAIYETNVKGTENLLLAARDRGVEKIVYTSTEATIGSCDGRPGSEEMETSLDCLPGHYKKSKYLAEKLALEMCREGLPLVVVNPTMPVGPWDVKPTPTGQVVLDFLGGRMPACVNTGLNVVDVEDVARGHILALEKGRTGERYILGNENLTLRDIFVILERITGVRAPCLDIPLWLARGAAYVDEFVSGRVLRRPPRIPLEAVRAAGKFRHFDCSRAVRELGFSRTPVEQSFDKAVRWFRENGYVRA